MLASCLQAQHSMSNSVTALCLPWIWILIWVCPWTSFLSCASPVLSLEILQTGTIATPSLHLKLDSTLSKVSPFESWESLTSQVFGTCEMDLHSLLAEAVYFHFFYWSSGLQSSPPSLTMPDFFSLPSGIEISSLGTLNLLTLFRHLHFIIYFFWLISVYQCVHTMHVLSEFELPHSGWNFLVQSIFLQTS